MNQFDYAISQLDESAKVVLANEKVNRREGDALQADLERDSGHDFHEAIKVLKKRQKAPQITRK